MASYNKSLNFFISLLQRNLGIAPPRSPWYTHHSDPISISILSADPPVCDYCCMLHFDCNNRRRKGFATSTINNVGDKRPQMNPFPDGGGGSDHILLTRGDVTPI